MHLTVRDDEAHRLACELAALTGESVTEAVNAALRERLERLHRRVSEDRRGIADRLLAIGDECAALPLLDDRSPDRVLYDENGLPA